MEDNYIKLYDWMFKISDKKSVVLVAALIYSYEEKKEMCILSYEDIAEAISITKRSAIRAVNELEDLGIIRKYEDRSDLLGTLPNTYEMISKEVR